MQRVEVEVLFDKSSIQYVASQPWPFPGSCMIGMSAISIDGLAPIHIDPNEIVDAQWFDKETVYQAARDTDGLGAVMERQVVM
jgi:NAD+ diphosphatase